MKPRSSRLLVLLGLLAMCCWTALAGDAKFHPPQTEAEIALSKLFHLDGSDLNLLAFALGAPDYDRAKDTGYAPFFTQKLLAALRKAQSDLVQADCGGKYLEGELCGMDFDPITCAQDVPDAYLFRTIRSDKDKSTVASAWSQEDEDVRYYSLVKEPAGWKLDGIYCSKDDHFNMPSKP